jgi:hypothetical protein
MQSHCEQKGEKVPTKRSTKSLKPGKKVKSLALSAKRAKGVKGGLGGSHGDDRQIAGSLASNSLAAGHRKWIE